MGDRGLPLRPEEQYPLLKVDSGGDTNVQPPIVPITAQGWTVTCTKKQSWLSKWPEFVSAVWMSLILFGISFLVFYAIGMGVYRRQQLLIVKCNNSRASSNVFYHQLIPRGGELSFVKYVEYLSHMAVQYPKLHFNVLFLIDDTYPSSRSPRHARFLSKFMSYYGIYNFHYQLDEANQQALFEFQRRFQNVNVSIIPLGKYMLMTPLRYRWKIIPKSYITFYTRVYSVWENGGIGIDLTEFNNKYNLDYQIDRRIAAILRQHNDGINPEAYANALIKIDKDEQTALFSMFYGIINQFLNETKSFFNRTLSFPTTPVEKTMSEPLSRSRRFMNTSLSKNSSADLENPISRYNQDEFNTTNDFKIINTVYFADNDGKDHIVNGTDKANSNLTDSLKLVLFYDFSLFSDNIGPPYIMSDPMTYLGPVKNKKLDAKRPNISKLATHLLSLNSDGTFIAASSKLHPFLGHVISMGCQRLQPKLAIQEAIISQCSGLLKNDMYCNNIYYI